MHADEIQYIESLPKQEPPSQWSTNTRRYNMSTDHTMSSADIRALAAIVWDKTKAKDEPPFSACAVDHQQRLEYAAAEVIRSDAADTDFEKEVKRLLDHPDDLRAAVAKNKVDAAQARVDAAAANVKSVQAANAAEAKAAADAAKADAAKVEAAKAKK